jgi:putative oxidoreductase
MKVFVLICRLLLGFVFLLFGLNTLLHFLPMPLPTGDALTWFGVMAGSHWINFVGVLEVVGGLLLLVGRFVPLALTLLAPVIVNILLYHSLLWPHGYIPAILVAILECILLIVYRRNFLPLLASNPEADTRTP